VINGD